MFTLPASDICFLQYWDSVRDSSRTFCLQAGKPLCKRQQWCIVLWMPVGYSWHFLLMTIGGRAAEDRNLDLRGGDFAASEPGQGLLGM